jgi:hypothetical protein
MPHQEIVEDLTGDCQAGYCLLREILANSGEEVPEHDPRYGHCSTGDCPLKQKVMESGLSDRALEQIKCVEIFKWNEGRTERKDIGWDEAWSRWVARGHAAAFAGVYQDGRKHRELYRNVMRLQPVAV